MPDNPNIGSDYNNIGPSTAGTQEGQSGGYPTSGDYGAESGPNSPDK